MTKRELEIRYVYLRHKLDKLDIDNELEQAESIVLELTIVIKKLVGGDYDA